MSRAEPTRADLSKWKRLVWEAQASAEQLARPAGDLLAAATAATKAVVPGGLLSSENPYVRLLRSAQRFVTEDARGRAGMAHELEELAERCASMLKAPPAEPRRRLPYADD